MNSIDSGGPPSFMQLNHPTAITALTISQQNVHCQSVLLFTGGQDNVIRVWTLADFCLLQNLTGHHRSILCLTLAPSIGQESTGKSQTTYPRLISSGADGTIRIWQDMISSGHSTSIDSDSDSKSNSNSSRNNNNDNPPPHYECVRIVSGCNGHVLSMLSSFGTMILGGQDGKIMYDEKILMTTRGGGIPSQSAESMIIQKHNQEKTQTKEEEEAMTQLNHWPFSLDHGGLVYTLFQCKSDVFWTGSSDTCVKRWSIDSSGVVSCSGTLRGHSGSVLALVGNDQFLFSGSQDQTIRCWDLTQQRRGSSVCTTRAIMKSQELAPVLSLALVKRGSTSSGSLRSSSSSSSLRSSSLLLVSGSADSTIRLWSCATYSCLSVIRKGVGHDGPVTSLVSTHEFLISSSLDGSVKCWDLHELIKTLLRTPATGQVQGDDGKQRKSRSTTLGATTDALETTKKKTREHDDEDALAQSKVGLDDSDQNDLIVVQMLRETTTSGSNHDNTYNSNPCSTTLIQPSNRLMIQLLRTFVSIKSISGVPALKSECWKAANFVKTILSQMGADCRLEYSEPGNNPLVLAQLGKNPNHRTILICGHYDVQPAEREDGWHTPPFELTGENGFLYGRGVTDDKGEGENRSLGYQDVVDTHVSWLKTEVDLIFISNNYWIGDDVPCLTTGMRGTIELELSVCGPSNDIHSGVDGGVIREPLHDLLFLLNRTLDDETGTKCKAPSFYDKVRQVKPEDFLNIQDFDVKAYQEQYLGVSVMSEEHALMDRWSNPSISITKVHCSMSNTSIIPKQAHACVNVRTVPDQDPLTIQHTLTRHLELEFENLKTKNRLEIKVKSNVPWWLGDSTNHFYQQAELALEKHWGMKPMLVKEGGTSSNTTYLEEQIQAPCLHFPLGQSSDRAHLQNERLRLQNLTTGKAVLVDFFSSVAKK